MTLPNRSGSAGSYRYSFQGQEKDDEVKGEGNSINYKYRMHDPRVGRFFAVDPLTHNYPWYTPYSFSGNKVIAHGELEGLEEAWVIRGEKIVHLSGPYPEILTGFDTYDQASKAQVLGFKNRAEVEQFIEAQEEIIVTSMFLGPRNKETISKTLSIQEKYPHHFPGHVMGPQLFEGGKELVSDMLLVGVINKISQARKLLKAYRKAKKAAAGANKVKNGTRTGNGLAKLKKTINPDGGKENCVLCSIAFEKKLSEGINKFARATGPDTNFISTIKKYFPNARRFVTFGSTKGLYDMLGKVGKSQKSGIVIGYFRKEYATKRIGAHAFNAIRNKNGTWKFIDAQKGREYTKEGLEKLFGKFDVIFTK